MKANYNRKSKNVREKAVAFRTKEAAFCLAQSTLYGRMLDDKDVVYLDFENDAQIDKLINTLQVLKSTHKKVEEESDESKTES